MRAIEVRAFGGPEVLELVELPDPVPGPGELLVEVAAAGVNFRDLMHRSGGFGATVPFVPGCEGAGRVLDVGNDVAAFRRGDRVAWKQGPSYAERSVVEACETVHLPDAVSDEQGAAVLLQGLTAHVLATACAPVGPGTVVLVHAAAGGVGHLLTQLVTRRGGRVIATVSTPAKVGLARRVGAEDVLVTGLSGAEVAADELAAEVRALTGGVGVDIAFDGVGAPSFPASLASLRTRGTVVLYGASGGRVAPVDPMALMAAGSVVLMRPSVRDFTARREELEERAADLFSWLVDGSLEVTVTGRFPLEDAAQAHIRLEERSTTGKLLLKP